jgi:hypothetical protein
LGTPLGTPLAFVGPGADHRRSARQCPIAIAYWCTGLLLFGWIYTVFSAVMLVTVGLLLRAQLRADRAAPPASTGRLVTAA